jgi:hypothetical protein
MTTLFLWTRDHDGGRGRTADSDVKDRICKTFGWPQTFVGAFEI